MLKKIYSFNKKKLLLFLRDEVDISVANEVFVLREYRRAEEIIRSATNPIFDIGAHAGFFTLYCRAFNKKVPIYAFEPEEKNYEALTKTVAENKLSKIKIIKQAVWHKTGQANFKITTDSHSHQLLNKKTDKTITTKTITLTDFLTSEKIPSVSLIKADIEGAEFEIFSELPEKTFQKIANVILEYHEKEKDQHKKLESIFRRNGFSVQVFPSKFDKKLGFLFAHNKRFIKR